MNELEFQEEWLSAYLDDELTDEQRQVVEKRLAIDPAAHATLEDLQRVRAMIAKLPSWSGPDLKFDIPSGGQSNFDEANEEIDDSEDDPEDFDEVPRLIAGVEEPRDSKPANENRKSDFRSIRSMLGWIAMAASVLLVAGLGYLNWPPTGLHLSYSDVKQAPPIAAKEATQSLQLGRTTESSAPPTEDEVRGGRLAEIADPAPLSDPHVLSEATGLGTEERLAGDKKESKMKVDSYSIPERPLQTPSAGLAGGFGEGAKNDLALRILSADVPAADLPQPSPANAPRSLALPGENAMKAEDLALEKTQMQRNGFQAPAVYFARSQSWMDEEAKSSLPYGANEYSANQLAFGSKALQRDASQKNSESEPEGVLMAGIKPEIANSPEFFQGLVISNNLIEVDQGPAINISATDNLQNSYSASPVNRDATGNTAPVIESANPPISNMFSNQRFQMGVPNSPLGNTYVLFLNQDEASQILNGLQEKGQVSSQVWRVKRQNETQTALGRRLNVTPPAEPQNAADARAASDSQNGRAETATNAKVVLLLNGPPN